MNEPTVKSVWTPDDEARFKELQERRERIYAENLGRVTALFAEWYSNENAPHMQTPGLPMYVAQRAAEFVAALQPFLHTSA